MQDSQVSLSVCTLRSSQCDRSSGLVVSLLVCWTLQRVGHRVIGMAANLFLHSQTLDSETGSRGQSLLDRAGGVAWPTHLHIQERCVFLRYHHAGDDCARLRRPGFSAANSRQSLFVWDALGSILLILF